MHQGHGRGFWCDKNLSAAASAGGERPGAGPDELLRPAPEHRTLPENGNAEARERMEAITGGP